ncbi:MAG TPA: phosphoadenosine phosphosulfate reductase family protein, partial [Allocoleopsis sp.]
MAMYQLQEAIKLALHLAESFEPQLPELAFPPVVEQALEMGADLAVSTSGGKDSDYLFRRLVEVHRLKGYEGRIFAIFADLGRIEWIGVHEHLHKLCKELGVELITVRRPQGGMVDRWQQRYESILAKDENKPHWSSSQNRFCTDHLKVQQIDKELRKASSKPHWSSSQSRFCTAELKRQQIDKDLRSSDLVVCAVGIRAQESPNRAKEPVVSVRDKISSSYLNPPSMKELGLTSKDKELYSRFEEGWTEIALAKWLEANKKGRLALTWHPILHHSIDDVWAGNGTSQTDVDHRSALFKAGKIREALEGFPCHWAYVSGNSRLSCGMCVLASKGDISNGA